MEKKKNNSFMIKFPPVFRKHGTIFLIFFSHQVNLWYEVRYCDKILCVTI